MVGCTSLKRSTRTPVTNTFPNRQTWKKIFDQAHTKPGPRLAPPTRNSLRSSTAHHHSLERLNVCGSSHHLTSLLHPCRCGEILFKPLHVPEWTDQVDWPNPASAPQRSSKHLLILHSRHGAPTQRLRGAWRSTSISRPCCDLRPSPKFAHCLHRAQKINASVYVTP